MSNTLGRRKMKHVDAITGDDRSYYWGRISRDEAVDALVKNGFDGSFLLRMSESQDGVYTISVMQDSAVRHIRIVNTAEGGYALSKEDPPESSVWQLVENQMHCTLTNQHNDGDNVALKYPLKAPNEVIAPDLLLAAEDAGLSTAHFDDDVAGFLEGAVDVKEMVRRRSMKVQPPAKTAEQEREEFERFMNSAECQEGMLEEDEDDAY